VDIKGPIPENLQKLLNEKPAPVNSSGNPSSFEEPPWAQPRYLSAPFPGYNVFEAQPKMTNPEGNGSLGIMFMGEAPGEWEESVGLPFRPHAQAGSVLQRAFNELGIQRSLALITNASWFRPPRNWLEEAPWQHDYVADGRLRNLELISRFRPQVIVALGKIAFQELTGMYEVGIEQGRGFIVPARKEYGSIPVIGTYHPSFIIRGAKRKSVETGAMTEKASGGGWSFYSILKRDIALAMLVQKTPFPATNFQDPRFVRFGTRDHWDLYYRRALENPNLPISYDFATPMSVAQTDESEFERAMGNITQFQVALEPGEALVSSWDHSLYVPIKKLMELPNPKLDWNGRGFDREILRNLGINLVGEYHDLMRMWSHWERDLPRGLQFATSYVSPQDGPWKHTFDQDLRSYGVRDVHEPQKIWDFLRKNMTGVKHPAGKDLLWGYQRQVFELHTKILDPLQELGIPVNEQRRAELRECLLNLEAKVNAEVNELVPEHLKPSKQPNGLKGVPKEILAELKPDLDIEAEYAAESEVSAGYAKKVTKKRIAEFYKELCQKKVSALSERYLVLDKVFVQRNFPISDKFGVVLGYERRWAELEEFNSNSSHQLLAYIEWKHKDEVQSLGPSPSKTALKNVKFKIPLDYKTKKPTTAKKELDRLAEKTGDPVIKRVVEYRELAKMRSTYVEGWAPGPDGRVHPFYDDNTGTSQLTAVRPAALTFPKHLKRKINFSAGVPLEKIRNCVHEWKEESGGSYICAKCEIPSKSYELGKLVRTMIDPRPGHRILEFDFKAFHVLTTGFEANDEKYMRLARLDMHSFIAATQLLGLAKSEELIVLPDKELMRVLKEFRKDPTPRYHGPGGIKVPFEFVRGKQAKPAILGYGFGMQPPRFYHENQEFLPSLDFAHTVFMGLDREFPICAAWRKNIVNFAYRQGGFLISQHGFIRRFNCCVDKFPVDNDYRPKPGETIRIAPDGMRWCFGPGDDAEAIIAFLPANDAFGMIKETMLRLETKGLTKKYNLIIPIHDALVFECSEEFVDECVREVTMEMQKPSDILILPNDQGGLWCEVEASINKPGMSWAEMDEIKL